ncbi:MAG TPA: glycoside hydrolase family 3 C-terminal domain-containing protein [Fimbriimonadaceae bacterium]|nr:glycoside hydrolase family 3 C-terminal domain-containing protein [Fimbriimonadaceae bacterium]
MSASRITFALSLLSLGSVVMGSGIDNPPYKNPKLPVEQRVQDLLKRMTTQEKIAQLRSDGNPKIFEGPLKTTGFGFIPLYPLRGMTPAKLAETLNDWQKEAMGSRLGIPFMPYEESLHGCIDSGHTSFPQAIGLAATWDPDLIHRVALAISQEDRSNGIRQVLSPVINVCRDARWGRMEESYGEDPLLTSRIAVAFCSALEKAGVVTTPKHYVANLWDGGRDSHAVEISLRSLFDVYMPPFKAVFQEAGARSVMCSYNAVNGVPCASDHWLLTDVLRGDWGFKGYVVSDWGAANNVWERFHVVGTEEQCAAALLNAGMDAEHPGVYIYGKGLDDAVAHGLISQKTLDTAVGRILRVKFEIGLFDDPYVDPAKAAAAATDPAHTALAREAAERAMVLLKNQGQTLPLSSSLHRIAVFGDLANGQVPLGGYSGNGNREQRKSILEGLRDHSPNTQFDFVPGCAIGGDAELPPVPVSALQTPGGQPGLTGEYWTNMTFQGDPKISRTDSAINFNWDNEAPASNFPREGYSVRWTGFLTAPETGDYEVSITSDDGMRLMLDGKTIVEDWGEHAAKTTTATVSLRQGQKVPIRVEYYQNGGQASARLGWKRLGATDTFLDHVREAASNADAVLVFAGIREGEGQDRAYLKLPGNQEDVIKAASAAGKPVIVVLVAGAPVTMEGWLDKASAILDAWYPGQEGADAIANVLYGDANPSGKLPMTFPRTVGQCPLYYNLEPSGRGYDYVDSTGAPLFPFGHGLSYTTFAYSNVKVSGSYPFTVSVDVENTGKRAGTEVVQLYTHQQVASVIQPLEELEGFQAVSLQPGEKKTVTFTLGFDQLSMWDANMRRVVEPGKFDVMIGSSAEDIRQRAVVTVAKGVKGEAIAMHPAGQR